MKKKKIEIENYRPIYINLGLIEIARIKGFSRNLSSKCCNVTRGWSPWQPNFSQKRKLKLKFETVKALDLGNFDVAIRVDFTPISH